MNENTPVLSEKGNVYENLGAEIKTTEMKNSPNGLSRKWTQQTCGKI